MLLPEFLNDFVDEATPVRVVDALMDMRDLSVLGYNSTSEATGRLGYHPGLMLLIYLNGHLNQVQLSRRLEH